MLNEMCPICGRSLNDVASKSAAYEHKILRNGVSVALGKRTSCVECGLTVLGRRDERRHWKSASTTYAGELAGRLKKQCKDLVEKRRKLSDEIEMLSEKMQAIRKQTWRARLGFIFRGWAISKLAKSEEG